MARETDEIVRQLQVAVIRTRQGSKQPTLTYEEGVAASLAWVLGHDESPIEGEDVLEHAFDFDDLRSAHGRRSSAASRALARWRAPVVQALPEDV